MITITSDEYSRLLQNEVKLIKFETLCQKKAVEVKRLQDQVAHYKRQAMKNASNVEIIDSETPPKADVWK